MKRLGEANRARELAVQTALQERIERPAIRALTREFRSTMVRMVADYERTGIVSSPDDHIRRLTSTLSDAYSDAISTMGARVLGSAKSIHGPAHRKAIDGPSYFDLLLTDYLSGLGDNIQRMGRTTQLQIVRVLAAARDEGLGVAAQAKVARTQIPVLSAFRSALIARTETHSAAQYANVETAKVTGLETQKEWIAAADERTREDHEEADGQVVSMDEAFTVGGELMAYPGEYGASAGNVINCRCVSGIIVL